MSSNVSIPDKQITSFQNFYAYFHGTIFQNFYHIFPRSIHNTHIYVNTHNICCIKFHCDSSNLCWDLAFQTLQILQNSIK